MAATFPTSPEAKKVDFPCWQEPKEACLFPDWVLLGVFGRVHCYDDLHAAASAVGNDATAVEVHTTSGHSGYFSFALRAPPSVSYLDLHWPYDVSTSVGPFPIVLSADANYVLLRIDICNEYNSCPDMFVYAASSSPAPSLCRLPACTKKAQGFLARKFMMVDTDIGILCRGGSHEDYVVAELVVYWKESDTPGPFGFDYIKGSPAIAALCVFSSRKGEWTVHEMPAPQPPVQGEVPICWEFDRVIPFAGRFLCWVDYYSGILLCDLSDDNSPVLFYSLLPGKLYPNNDEKGPTRGCLEASRRVSVSQGMMHFVQIDEERKYVVRVWNLSDRFIWEMQYKVNLSHIWTQPDYLAAGLAHCKPEFPVVTNNVLCFVLRDEDSVGKLGISMFDMKSNAFEGLYAVHEDFFVYPLTLRSDFSKCLNRAPSN